MRRVEEEDPLASLREDADMYETALRLIAIGSSQILCLLGITLLVLVWNVAFEATTILFLCVQIAYLAVVRAWHLGDQTPALKDFVFYSAAFGVASSCLVFYFCWQFAGMESESDLVLITWVMMGVVDLGSVIGFCLVRTCCEIWHDWRVHQLEMEFSRNEISDLIEITRVIVVVHQQSLAVSESESQQ